MSTSCDSTGDRANHTALNAMYSLSEQLRDVIFSNSVLACAMEMDTFDIADRASWDAAPPTEVLTIDKAVPFVIIHHSDVPAACYTSAKCKAAMRSMQFYHQNTRGWADIGYKYNFTFKFSLPNHLENDNFSALLSAAMGWLTKAEDSMLSERMLHCTTKKVLAFVSSATGWVSELDEVQMHCVDALCWSLQRSCRHRKCWIPHKSWLLSRLMQDICQQITLC